MPDIILDALTTEPLPPGSKVVAVMMAPRPAAVDRPAAPGGSAPAIQWCCLSLPISGTLGANVPSFLPDESASLPLRILAASLNVDTWSESAVKRRVSGEGFGIPDSYPIFWVAQSTYEMAIRMGTSAGDRSLVDDMRRVRERRTLILAAGGATRPAFHVADLATRLNFVGLIEATARYSLGRLTHPRLRLALGAFADAGATRLQIDAVFGLLDQIDRLSRGLVTFAGKLAPNSVAQAVPEEPGMRMTTDRMKAHVSELTQSRPVLLEDRLSPFDMTLVDLKSARHAADRWDMTLALRG